MYSSVSSFPDDRLSITDRYYWSSQEGNQAENLQLSVDLECSRFFVSDFHFFLSSFLTYVFIKSAVVCLLCSFSDEFT